MQDGFHIKNLHIPNRLILAPMCGITLKPFRKVCKSFGAGLVFNQMVSAKALTMGDKKSFHLMGYDESERPIGLQVFGNDPDILGEAARIIAEQNPDVIDLNLGCPAKKIVNDGGGSALMGEIQKLKHIFKNMRAAIPGAFTVKIRAGWDDKSKNAIDVAKMAQDAGVDAIAIHGRTRAQGYSGKSDWDFIRQLKEALTIPVIGNGDVKVAEDAHRMMRETGCDAVMTGRGAFETPWIFADFLNHGSTEPDATQLKNIILTQYKLAMEYHGEKGGVVMMRKHLCAYTKGLRGGAEFRSAVIRLENFDEIKIHLDDFLNIP